MKCYFFPELIIFSMLSLLSSELFPMSIPVSLEKISSKYLCWVETREGSLSIRKKKPLWALFSFWAFGGKNEMVWARIRRGKGCWSNTMWSAFVYECSRFIFTKLGSINSFDFLSHPPTRHVIDYFTRRRNTQPQWIFTSSRVFVVSETFARNSASTLLNFPFQSAPEPQANEFIFDLTPENKRCLYNMPSDS